MTRLNNEQARIKTLAENLLATINEVVPSSTIHYAVEDARRALAELIRKADTIKTAEPTTWTFFGHWDSGEIVVEYYYAGEVDDDRIDNGDWEEGLWAAAGSGATVEEARAAAIAEYEDDEEYDHSRAKEDARNAYAATATWTCPGCQREFSGSDADMIADHVRDCDLVDGAARPVPVRYWVEPVGTGTGLYGPFPSELEASEFMDSGSPFVSDKTHKIVPRPQDGRPFAKAEVRAEVMRQIPADYSPTEIDEIVDVVLAGKHVPLPKSVDHAIQGLEA